jgi:hypothetical protein
LLTASKFGLGTAVLWPVFLATGGEHRDDDASHHPRSE